MTVARADPGRHGPQRVDRGRRHAVAAAGQVGPHAYFLFGDGAGAAIISSGPKGHRIHQALLGSDTRGLHMARREEPGYAMRNGDSSIDPWIRMDGQALFRFATESFTEIIRQAIARSGWTDEETRWIIPHQANGRILKAAAKRSGVGFERFFSTSSTSATHPAPAFPWQCVDVEQACTPATSSCSAPSARA